MNKMDGNAEQWQDGIIAFSAIDNNGENITDIFTPGNAGAQTLFKHLRQGEGYSAPRHEDNGDISFEVAYKTKNWKNPKQYQTWLQRNYLSSRLATEIKKDSKFPVKSIDLKVDEANKDYFKYIFIFRVDFSKRNNPRP